MLIQHYFPNCRCFRFKTNRRSTNVLLGTRLK